MRSSKFDFRKLSSSRRTKGSQITRKGPLCLCLRPSKPAAHAGPSMLKQTLYTALTIFLFLSVCTLLTGVRDQQVKRDEHQNAPSFKRKTELAFQKVCGVARTASIEALLTNDILTAVEEASEREKLDIELLFSIMAAESRCRPSARSRAGAVGLMQVMPGTARSLGVEDASAVRDNIAVAAKYLSQLHKRFDGNLKLTLAAYNAGPGKVKRAMGIPAYPETKTYVKKVLEHYEFLRNDEEMQKT